MSAGFGFSAGDFVAALKLVSTITSALRASSSSSAEFQSLISQLETLRTILQRVQELEIDDEYHVEVVALRQAAAQCWRTIEGFWEKVKKYQPSLAHGGSGDMMKDGWRKVKWAVCKKEDLVRFKADLMGHAESIELLLTIVQMAESRRGAKRCDENARTLAGKVQESYFGCMSRISVVVQSASTCIQQGKELLGMASRIIHTNIQIFQIVLRIQDIVSRIPGNIELQPVYFVDAIGRQTPFHLEFITCPESLTAVLKNNFKTIGPGTAKIENGEFALQDSATKRDIDLASPWRTCFHPGQNVVMSMIFSKEFDPSTVGRIETHCPRCETVDNIERGSGLAYGDTECWKCHMIYRQYTSWHTPNRHKSLQDPPERGSEVSQFEKPDSRQIQHESLTLQNSEIGLFSKVRLRTVYPRSTLYVRAMYDYFPHEAAPDSLWFTEGDIIEIISTLDSGWWDGVLKGVRGWLPSNYCEVIQDQHDSGEDREDSEENSERETDIKNQIL